MALYIALSLLAVMFALPASVGSAQYDPATLLIQPPPLTKPVSDGEIARYWTSETTGMNREFVVSMVFEPRWKTPANEAATPYTPSGWVTTRSALAIPRRSVSAPTA